MVYRVESLLLVNEDRPSEKTVIHISTDFLHKKVAGVLVLKFFGKPD